MSQTDHFINAELIQMKTTQVGFPYFCLNLIKLDELGEIYNTSVETLQQ